MASTLKVYPATQAQVAAVDAKLDVINGKLPTPTYQVKTVTPSNIQQTIEPDNGYTGLSAVVVNPIAAAMPENLEDFVMRKDTMPEFSLSLSGDVPAYACYHQKNLVAVYGEPTNIGTRAFEGCTLLSLFDFNMVTSVSLYAFEECTNLRPTNTQNIITISSRAFEGCKSITNLDIRSMISISDYAFHLCVSMVSIDCRNVTFLGGECFYECTVLKYIDCRNISQISTWVFGKCTSLTILDMTNCDVPPTLADIDAFSGVTSDWKGVFKNDTVKTAVQSATNWSTYASHIYTVAEIEALYGDTYDNLYLQWFGHARN